MKKKLVMGAFVLIISIAMVAAATMAWFTDFAESGEATFQAGTVSIEAGSSAVFSHYFDPAEKVFLYGVVKKDGAISGLYEIDVKNGDAHMFLELNFKDLEEVAKKSGLVSDARYTNSNIPNGLAFDKNNKRLYFSMLHGSNTDLFFYDFKNKEIIFTGRINGTSYGAAFYNGSYWFIKNNSDTLVRVTYKPGEPIKTNTVDLIPDGSMRLGFGDVVIDIKDGILYGCTSNGFFFKYIIDDSQLQAGEERFQQIILEPTNFNKVKGMQIAFGSDGVLYGHSDSNKGKIAWYTIDINNNTITQIDFTGSNFEDYDFNDLASGYVSVWNPGDEDYMKYYVKNTGSKRIRVRAKIEGDWEGDLDNHVVSLTSADDNWTDEYEDGYFYYKGILNPNETVELRLRIELKGKETSNDYQGKTYTLSGLMEAVQASNGAPEAVWNVPIDEDYK